MVTLVKIRAPQRRRDAGALSGRVTVEEAADAAGAEDFTRGVLELRIDRHQDAGEDADGDDDGGVAEGERLPEANRTG